MYKQLNASEWKIMEYLWDAPPKTLMQTVKAMNEQVGWAKSTVTTMITRMEQKGLLRFEEGGRAKLIYPAVSHENAASIETDTLLKRAYGGSVGMMVSSLVDGKALSREEIDELYAIIRQAEEKANDSD